MKARSQEPEKLNQKQKYLSVGQKSLFKLLHVE